ncbi:MAG: aromatic ring-hydroxylating dioxygenase subunit alpha [Ilumatobacteraceae bacterium]|nr:aromatic ring-hydroxylating dioxygenase subunit alpha [Ilumatobacteraceae bacterium]
MTASPITDVARRLLANVDAGRPDHAAGILEVPVRDYLDPQRFERELDVVFHRSPLLVALSCDVAEPGDFTTLDIAGRPIVVMRGDDGVVRTFLNACRHRGASVADECFGHARRLTCPYHFWVYDTAGKLVGVTGPEGFEGMEVEGLIEYPTAERAGAVFAVLTVGATFDVDEWLGDMASALEMLQLDKLHRYDVETRLPSGSWKATADGYVDGYHLGYLHRSSIGARSITNRNTYDTWGPHVRIGFANKPIVEMRDTPAEEWDLYEAMSLVHFVFPNVSLSGQPDRSIMFSRILPGPTVGECTVSQYQYFRQPLVDDAAIAEAEAKRARYEAVTYEEDFLTVMGIGRRMPAMADDVVRFGRNEIGNQTIHTWIDRLLQTSGD